MGKKGRRKETSKGWYASETDESDANTPGGHKSSEVPATLAVDTRGESTSNGQTGNRNGDGGARGGKRAGPSHPKHDVILESWTQAVGEAIQDIGTAQRAIENLQGIFTSHMDDLGRVDSIKNQLEQLEEDCRDKDKVMQEQETTIGILRSMDQKARASIEDEQNRITREREELKLERTKIESRVEVATAEERYIMQRNFDERVAEHDGTHETRMKDLEADFTRKSDEMSARAICLEADKRRALNTAEQQEEKLKAQADELDRLKKQHDILDRATDSFKREKEGLETELEMIKKEFALDSRTAAYFKQQFADICGEIENISWKYFHDNDEEDWEDVHNRLIKEDSCFKSVPIDGSEDSGDLCAAHAQRIISAAIHDDVWKPLRSELTFPEPKIETFLGKMSDALDKSDYHGRTADVWTALTMRALQALDAEAAFSVPESAQDCRSIGGNRANSVISKVFHVLGPLVSAPQIESLKMDLLTVVNLSVVVWNNAHSAREETAWKLTGSCTATSMESNMNRLLQDAYVGSGTNKSFFVSLRPGIHTLVSVFPVFPVTAGDLLGIFARKL